MIYIIEMLANNKILIQNYLDILYVYKYLLIAFEVGSSSVEVPKISGEMAKSFGVSERWITVCIKCGNGRDKSGLCAKYEDW